MRIGDFELQEPLPQLESPHSLVMLRPWIDVGNVGEMSLSWLETQLGAKELGKLVRPGVFFDFTRYRPVSTLVEGRRELITPNSTIRYAKYEGSNDFLFFHILEPHANGEDYVDSIFQVMEQMGTRRYCLIGSMYDVVPHTKPLLVTGGASDEGLQRQLRILSTTTSSYQGPTTILYLLSQKAREANMETMTLIVHLPQYLQLEEDHAGELRLLELISQVYNLPGKLDNVRRQAEKQYAEVNTAVAADPRLRSLVAQLEAQYTSRIQREAEAQPPTPLSPEIERFLRQMDEGQGPSQQ